MKKNNWRQESFDVSGQALDRGAPWGISSKELSVSACILSRRGSGGNESNKA